MPSSSSHDMMSSIDISGIDKAKLLHLLWTISKPAAHLQGFAASPVFSVSLVNKALLRHIDYFCGRPIHCDLSGDSANPELYDRNAYPGAFLDCVRRLSVKHGK